jgi:molecular chaperone DnaK
VEETDDPRAAEILRRIDEEQIVQDVSAMVEAAGVDPDAATTCGKRLLDLKAAIDELEAALEWPQLVQESRDLMPALRDFVMAQGNENHRRSLATGEAAVREAIAAHDANLLRQRLDDLHRLASEVLDDSGELPFLVFEDLKPQQPEMRDPAEAAQLIAAGERAVANRDPATLRAVNHQLVRMLPEPPPPIDPFSTVRKH